MKVYLTNKTDGPKGYGFDIMIDPGATIEADLSAEAIDEIELYGLLSVSDKAPKKAKEESQEGKPSEAAGG